MHPRLKLLRSHLPRSTLLSMATKGARRVTMKVVHSRSSLNQTMKRSPGHYFISIDNMKADIMRRHPQGMNKI